MKLKLACKLKFRDPNDKIFIEGVGPGVIADETNIFEIADNLSDAEIKNMFDQFRTNMMKRYHAEIFSFFKVELTEIKD